MSCVRLFSAARLGALALAAGLFTAPGFASENYPTRPVQVIVPFSSGSGSDVIARLLFGRISQNVGQQFVIDNRPAAGGIVGTRAVVAAAPDGYTILFNASGPIAINKALMKNLPYDPERDLAPISKVAELPNVFVVNTRVPARTVREFVEFAKKQSNPLVYSSIGNGSSSHLAAAHFGASTGIELTHAPYKAMSQLVSDLISGEVPVTFTVFSNANAALQSGQVRALAVAAPARLPVLPEVPTLTEAGFPGLETSAWFAVLGPRETPQSVVDFLNRAIATALADPALRAKLDELGARADRSSPDGLRTAISVEIEKWRKVSEQTGIKIDP